jgi:diacylglycerol kinase (ATP)
VDKEKILFIVNPISGSKSKAGIPVLIDRYLDKKKYDHQIVFTDYGGQGSEIAALALVNGVNIVVAVGGDGTVNEIGKVLLGSKVSLAIIPAGSGNGLARHLKIPMDTVKAIKAINQGIKMCIDAGRVNDRYFFCTAGVGFDALIGNLFARKAHRGLKGYIGSTIKEFFAYTPETYKITNNGDQLEKKAFLVTFANASQYGNNAYIAPNAAIDDHMLDICIMKNFPVLAGPLIGFRIFAGNIHHSRYVEFLRTKQIVLERESPGVMHLDGEPVQMGKQLIVTSIPSCLHVIVGMNIL